MNKCGNAALPLHGQNRRLCGREDKRKCSSDMLNAEAEECRGCAEVCSHGKGQWAINTDSGTRSHQPLLCVLLWNLIFQKVTSDLYCVQTSEIGVLVCIRMSGWLHVRLIHRSCWSSRGSRLPVKLSTTFTWPCRCSCRLQCFRPPVKKKNPNNSCFPTQTHCLQMPSDPSYSAMTTTDRSCPDPREMVSTIF